MLVAGNVHGMNDTDAETLKQQAEAVTVNSTMCEAVSDSQTGFNSDETLHHFTGAAEATVDSQSNSTTEPSFSGAASTIDRTECKQNSAAPVMNGALETDSDKTHIYARPLTGSDATPGLREPNILSLTLSDVGAFGDHNQQPPVSPGNTEPFSEAEFIAVVRRKRKDAGAKPKTQQSDDLGSFWHRKPARPTHTSPKSNIHHSAGRLSPTHMQPVSQKSANPSSVSLWDSTPSAFPALPSLRVRRNSTGDVPPTSESNEGSDLESVKSVQSYTGRRTAWGHSQGTSSYASVVVGNVSNKEPVSQPISDIRQKSWLSDGGVDVIPSHSHSSDHSTFHEESAIPSSAMESTNVVQGSLPAAFGNSDFMVDSSIVIHEDAHLTDDKVGYSRHSVSCAHGGRRSRPMLFFDTRSKSSSTPVPSLDISFGFDDTMAAEAISSCNMIVTSELEATAASTPRIPQAEPMTSVEFLQQSSVTDSATGSRTSTAAVPRSLFDLRAAQRYLLSGE